MKVIKLRNRPYTSIMVKNPTYPTIVGNRIVELPWQEPEVIPRGFSNWKDYALDEKRRRQEAQIDLERYKGLLAKSRIDLMRQFNGNQLPIPNHWILTKTYQYGLERVEIWTDGDNYIYRSGVYFPEMDVVEWFNQSPPCKIGNVI